MLSLDSKEVIVRYFCRNLRIRVADRKTYAEEWAAIEATAVNAAPRRRMAVVMALHPR